MRSRSTTQESDQIIGNRRTPNVSPTPSENEAEPSGTEPNVPAEETPMFTFTPTPALEFSPTFPPISPGQPSPTFSPISPEEPTPTFSPISPEDATPTPLPTMTATATPAAFTPIPTMTPTPQEIGTCPAANPGAYVLGAYYFATWSSTFNHRLENSQIVYHRRDHWAGVRDFHGDPDASPPIPQDTSGWLPVAPFAQLKPAIGYYDLDDATTFERHIRQARAHGLTFFNFYWYWHKDRDSGNGAEVVNAGLRNGNSGSFLSASNTQDMKFMLSVYTNNAFPDYTDVPPAQMEHVIGLWLDYMAQPNYLRARDGRPVFNVGQISTSQNAVSLLTLLRTRGLERSPAINVLVTMEAGLALQVSGLDGYSCLQFADLAIPDPPANLWSYSRWVDRFAAQFQNYTALHPNFTWLPCFMTDFDERARTAIEYGGDATLVRRVSDWSEAKLALGLERLRTYMDARPAGDPLRGYAVLYAWNEWSEELMNVEPSAANGASVLEKVANAFAIVPEGSEQCRLLGAP